MYCLDTTKISRLRRYKHGSRQNMGGRDIGAERAGRFVANFFKSIKATGRTWWNFPVTVQFDIIGKVVRKVDGVAVCLAMFQRELIGSGINLAHIVDASIGRTGARSGAVW